MFAGSTLAPAHQQLAPLVLAPLRFQQVSLATHAHRITDAPAVLFHCTWQLSDGSMTLHMSQKAAVLLPLLQVDADSSVLRGKLGEMLNAVLGRQAHKAELAAWFSVSWQSRGGEGGGGGGCCFQVMGLTVKSGRD